MSDFHPLVELMLARMESHPGEFEGGDEDLGYPPDVTHRWTYILQAMRRYTTPAENEALDARLRAIRMDMIHRDAMDELLNGDERRRLAFEEQEVRNKAMQMQNATMNAILQQQAQAYSAQQYTNTIGGLATATGVTATATQAPSTGITASRLASSGGLLGALTRRGKQV